MSAREHLDDDQFERLQLRIEKLEKFLDKVPFIQSGRLVKGQALSIGDNQFPHFLGRPVKGMIALNVSPAAAVAFSGTPPVDVTKFVNVSSSGNCTADLWFY